ncbi:hypothetical protein [Streptacidiphilus rugosus]|uniref:hypothetical protein n=1 Tax=Streptacidiphilus rugosus TaxID=405783 RepID=UPI0006915DE5|nr:hypothetical protein [Streptacidiphilus rugosus]
MTNHQSSEPPGAEPERAEAEAEAEAVHRLLEREVRGLPPSAPPIAELVRAGRARAARRTRLRAATAVAACVAAACAALPVLHAAKGPSGPSPLRTAAASPSRPSRPSTILLGSGVLDGTAWSVRAEFPGPTAGSADGELCLDMVIGGVRVDRRAGPHPDCDRPDGGRREAVFVADGTPLRLFVSYGADDVASVVLTFSDGTTARAAARPMPGTPLRGLAVPIGAGQVIAVVDGYDSHGSLVHRETDWR